MKLKMRLNDGGRFIDQIIIFKYGTEKSQHTHYNGRMCNQKVMRVTLPIGAYYLLADIDNCHKYLCGTNASNLPDNDIHGDELPYIAGLNDGYKLNLDNIDTEDSSSDDED